MALVCKELATDAMLDQVLRICPGRRPIETYTEGLAYKGLCCGVVAAECSMISTKSFHPSSSEMHL